MHHRHEPAAANALIRGACARVCTSVKKPTVSSMQRATEWHADDTQQPSSCSYFKIWQPWDSSCSFTPEEGTKPRERTVENVANGAITILQIVRSWAICEIETPKGCTSNNA